MSGKSYTMREMKSIVDYLVEHKAYNEIKGRKMWITFASSKATTRTWQSLKETFLKRILPDIQNPYYKLTMEQVRSFREGRDIETQNRNKLEIHTVSDDDSTSNGPKETNGEKPSSTTKEADMPSGEDIKSAQITRSRSSVDTLVLDDTYYSNAEEIQNVLENTAESDNNEEHKPFKDCLTFEQSESFSIDAMRVLEDFATDSEGSDKGLRMDIDENPPEKNNEEIDEPIEIQDTEDTPDLPKNPIEINVDVLVFGKETEDSIDQQSTQIPDNNEPVPENNQTNTEQNGLKKPVIINVQPVVISDQSDTNNDESDTNNKDADVDISNCQNDLSDITMETNEGNNDQVVEKSKSTEEKQDKVVEKDKETIVQRVSPLLDNNRVAQTTEAIAPETVETHTDKTILNDKEEPLKSPDSPKKIRISEPISISNETQNTSSNITDSLIPNNQEALNGETNDQTHLLVNQEKTKNSRKRSTSHESEPSKKIKIDESVNNSDVNKKAVENETTNNQTEDQTDIRKMNSDDLFENLLDSQQQNKETNEPMKDKTSEMELNENLENDEDSNNPCLKSVSLYAEQFNTTKILDSDSEVETAEQSNSQPKQPENSSKSNNLQSNEPVNSSKSNNFQSKHPENSSESNNLQSKQPENSSKSNNLQSKQLENSLKSNNLQSKQPENRSKSNNLQSKQSENSSKSKKMQLKQLRSKSNSLQLVQPENSSKSNKLQLQQLENRSKSKILQPEQTENSSKSNSLQPEQPENSSESNSLQPGQPENSSKSSTLQSKQHENGLKSKGEFIKDPIVLKSHSESDNNKNKSNFSKPVEKVKDKVRKESLLAKMLGFSGGAEHRNRRRSHKRTRVQRAVLDEASDSSEWTSDSDDEQYVPSRRRSMRNKHSRKYVKPKSAKIIPMDEEGGMFIMYRNKLYPLVKNGKNLEKNYLNYHSVSDSDLDEQDYWRQKYVEEKIRAEELKKRLTSVERRVSNSDKSDVPLGRKSPILQPSSSSRNASSHIQQNVSTSKASAVNNQEKEAAAKPSSSSQEKLKICFLRNNQEVQLEGYWPQIHPALQQVVDLLHTGDDSNRKSRQSTNVNHTEEATKRTSVESTKVKDKTDAMEVETVDIDSGKTTPIIPSIDPAIHEKISKIENEIFKEIEKRAKEEGPKVSESDNVNVAKRGRGRRIKSTTSESEKSKTAARQSRQSFRAEKQNKSTKDVQKEDESTSKQVEQRDESTAKQDEPTAKQDKSTEKQVQHEEPVTKQGENQDPSTLKQAQKQDESTVKQIEKQDELTVKQVQKNDNTAAKQVEKQDKAAAKTDEAVVMKRPTRTPRKLAVETPIENRVSTRRSTSRKSEQLDDEDEIRYKLPPNKKDTKPPVNKKRSSQHPVRIPEDASLRSIDSTQGYQDSDVSPINIKRKKKPSFKVHKTKKTVRRNSFSNLTDILSSDSSNSSYFIPLKKSSSSLNSAVYKTESYELLMPKERALKVLEPIDENQNTDDVRHFNSRSKNSDRSSSSNILIEVCSSSNVSLPPSPELSVVENLTLSREMIKPNITLNEMDCVNVGDENTNYDKYMISNFDVSCPLMEQECGLQNSNDNVNKKPEPVSESRIDKESTVTMKEKSISETINKKLHDLLLESAKKISNKDENMEVDETDGQAKAKPKKRSSTPVKRKTSKKRLEKPAQVNSLIEEEYMETCSFAGRTSCPPVITILPHDENANFAKTPADKKAKKKKDIIKVKIQRPESRTRDKSKSKNSTRSSITDSGINETENFSGMFLKANDSVDLIHNHSDTCLNANECIGDSLEFIENSPKSVISLNSNSSESELKRLMGSAEKSVDTISNQSNHAHDVSEFTKLPNLVKEIFRSPSVTLYHSPVSNSSLITEDLSDNTPPPNSPTKWYLLDEDDTNTQYQVSHKSCGSNLNKIFTSCAVPNLSTITEKSTDSKKVNVDGDTQNCDSQSLF